MRFKESLRAMAVAAAAMLSLGAEAQTFYEVHYSVGDGENDDYTGLLIYNSDEDCKLRLINQEALNEDAVFESQYVYHVDDKQDKDDVGIMMYYPVEENFPTFIWSWEEDDASDIDDAPMITFDPENINLEEMIEADYFEEITLADMDEEYIEQFYSKDEPEYQMMMEGMKKLKAQNQQLGIESDGEVLSKARKDVTDKSTAKNSDKKSNKNSNKKNSVKTTPVAAPQNVKVAGAKATMHLIVVANTEVSDIGQACKVDKENVRSEFKGIAKVLGLNFVEHIVAENTFNKEKLAETITGVTPGKEDVVIFIYSGHGFRFSDQKDYYPNMDLSATSYDDPKQNYVALSDIYKELQKKGARLSLVLSDCCNTEIQATRPVVSTSSLFSRANNNFDLEKLKALFMNTEGNLIATAASPGEFSWCGVNGGFFTLSLIESMRSSISMLSKDTPSWDKLIANAINTAASKSTANAACKKQNGLKYVQVKSRQ